LTDSHIYLPKSIFYIKLEPNSAGSEQPLLAKSRKNREKGREKSPFGKIPQITKYFFLLQILADIKQKIVI